MKSNVQILSENKSVFLDEKGVTVDVSGTHHRYIIFTRPNNVQVTVFLGSHDTAIIEDLANGN